MNKYMAEFICGIQWIKYMMTNAEIETVPKGNMTKDNRTDAFDLFIAWQNFLVLFCIIVDVI